MKEILQDEQDFFTQNRNLNKRVITYDNFNEFWYIWLIVLTNSCISKFFKPIFKFFLTISHSFSWCFNSMQSIVTCFTIIFNITILIKNNFTIFERKIIICFATTFSRKEQKWYVLLLEGAGTKRKIEIKTSDLDEISLDFSKWRGEERTSRLRGQSAHCAECYFGMYANFQTSGQIFLN